MRYLALFALLLAAPNCPPKPTPSPTPTPPVNRCADHPDLCVEGSVCVDTPIGPVCEAAPPPTPSPVCHEGETCGCWHRPPGEDWQQLPPCPTPPPTTPTGCTLAGEPGPLLPGHQPALGAAVNQAIAAVLGCSSGRCVVTDRPQLFQWRVAEKLRAMGYCAGQHTPTTDEIAVAQASGMPWEGYHIYAGPGWDDPNEVGTAVFSPQANRPAYAAPGTSPPPVTACGEPTPPDLVDFVLHCYARGLPWCDATPIVHGCGYKGPGTNFCRDIGLGEMPGGGLVRCDCPAGSEDTPAKRMACEREVIGRPGPPADATWKADGPVEINPTNHLQARCSSCSWISVCKADGTHCTKVTL